MTPPPQITERTMRTLILPGLAYLKSVRDQTLPARELALNDAVDHFVEAEASGDGHWRDLALLGVIGEAMQILEDLAYVGEAFTGPDRYKLPRYVSATKFSKFAPTNFYQQVKKWPDDRLLLFGGLHLSDGKQSMSLHEAVNVPLTSEQTGAILDAEGATAKQLRNHLLGLANAWGTFSKYFHAFKHGALVLDRDDFFIADENGNELDVQPSISVWDRRKDEGEVCADTNLTPVQVAAESAGQGRIAHAIASYIVEARLAGMEMMGIDEHGNVTEIQQISIPWRFWLDARALAPESRAALEALGVVFNQA